MFFCFDFFFFFLGGGGVEKNTNNQENFWGDDGLFFREGGGEKLKKNYIKLNEQHMLIAKHKPANVRRSMMQPCT